MAKEVARREAATSVPVRMGDPLRGIQGLRDTINSLFEDFFTGRPMLGTSLMMRPYFAAAGEEWQPAVDIKDTENELVVYAAVPGLHKSDVNVEVTDGTLVLSGECKCEEKAGKKEETWLRNEIPYGRFYRAFSLPAEVKSEQVKASCEDGVLEIHLPKALESKPHKIAIQ